MVKRAKRHEQALRNVPSYGISEAAHYLRIPTATLRSWAVGRPYKTEAGRQFFQPLIELADLKHRLLSFTNLVEAHVLDAIRRDHEVALAKARQAIEYVRGQFNIDHPLANQRFMTDGTDLFVRRYGQLINVSQAGQLALREFLEAYLRRVEWNEEGLAVRLFPFTRKREPDEPRVVVIDPKVSFGRPVLVGTGIPTSIVAERFKAGESMDSLAEDYDRPRSDIEEAIRCEHQLEAA